MEITDHRLRSRENSGICAWAKVSIAERRERDCGKIERISQSKRTIARLIQTEPQKPIDQCKCQDASRHGDKGISGETHRVDRKLVIRQENYAYNDDNKIKQR